MELFKLFGTIAINNSEANQQIDETTGKAESSGSKLGKVFSSIGSAATKVGKVVGVGMVAAASGIAALSKKSLDAYADYEQLTGGVETLFKDSADKVMEYANEGYRTAGLSANEYMETITSFSASLLQSLGGDTEKAAEKGNQAIIDMSDNANKMGSSMESIQNAYSGFAKQNFTMLDNLKLGYGGTKEEMERLLADATALSGIEYDISSYADIVDAIHVVQTELGITGTTSLEASTTISGSVASMKSAWENFLTSLGTGNDDMIADSINALVDSIVTVSNNIIPRLIEILPNLVDGLVAIINALIPQLPTIINMLLPALIEGAVQIVGTLIVELPNILKALWDVLWDLISNAFTTLRTNTEGEFGAIWEIIDKVFGEITTLWNEHLKPCFEAIGNFIQNTLAPLFELYFKTYILGVVKDVFGWIGDLWQNSLKPVFVGIIDFITGVFSGDWEKAFKGIISVAKGLLNGIGAIFKAPFDLAKSIVKNAIEFIKGLFKFEWNLPHIKLPHFAISPSGWSFGDLLKGSIPSLGIEWYSRGGVMDSATPFGMNGNRMMVGGEAGAEAIIPLERNTKGLDLISEKISERIGFNDNSVIQDKMNNIIELLEQLLGMNITLDSGALVGQLAPAMDTALGTIYEAKGRGGRSTW